MTIPTLSDAVPVMSVFGWTMIQQHIGYTFDWHLSWNEYKAGFGSTDADFWFGLEKVHLLTSSQPYRLRVEVQERSTNLWYSAEYWSFKIGDELNDKYRLEVAGYSGDAGDPLQNYHNGMKFTTRDNDNDLITSGNCAINGGGINRSGGWWYKSCMLACLTCKPVKFEWRTLQYGLIAKSRMMVKPQ